MPDGTIVFAAVLEGLLYRVWPETGRIAVFSDTGGGPNGVAPAVGGGVVIAQNSGYLNQVKFFNDCPTPRPVPPGLQMADEQGNVAALVNMGFQSPNDLAAAPDGTLYFTDPFPLRGRGFSKIRQKMISGRYPPEERWLGRVWAAKLTGDVEFVGTFSKPNGIGFDREGTLVVVEQGGLQRVYDDGSREWVIEDLGRGPGDGYCTDVDGRIYIASTKEHGIQIIEDGKEVEFWRFPVLGS